MAEQLFSYMLGAEQSGRFKGHSLNSELITQNPSPPGTNSGLPQMRWFNRIHI